MNQIKFAQAGLSGPPNRSCRLRLAIAPTLLIALSFATPASAQSESDAPPTEPDAVRGHVVALQEPELIVDLAAARGASPGDTLELWRPLRLRHPVTNEMIVDRFLIGRLKLVQVRQRLATAQIINTTRKPAKGDVVVLQKEAPGALDNGSARTADNGQQAPARGAEHPGDEQALAVTKLLLSLRGAPLARRIGAYQDFLRKYPKSRYAEVIREQANMVRGLARELASRRQAQQQPARHQIAIEPALAGRPLSLAVELGNNTRGAVLHHRRREQLAYSSQPMTSAGPGYFRTTIDGKAVRAGELQYFIEATDARGATSEVVASAQTPYPIEVRAEARPSPPQAPAASVALWTDYADYNRLRGNDTVWQTEGLFGLRFGDTGLRALRSGFGVYRGVGGSLEELDEKGLQGRLVGLTYGHLEGEVGFTNFVGLIGRATLGLNDRGVTGGGQLFVRLGNDTDTNLQLGGEALGGIGLRGIAQLELNVLRALPIMLRTEVTNQPAGSSSSSETVRPNGDTAAAQASLERNDVGGRGIVQVGYRIVDPLVLAIRGSYQGRTINHSGPGFGGFVSYQW